MGLNFTYEFEVCYTECRVCTHRNRILEQEGAVQSPNQCFPHYCMSNSSFTLSLCLPLPFFLHLNIMSPFSFIRSDIKDKSKLSFIKFLCLGTTSSVMLYVLLFCSVAFLYEGALTHVTLKLKLLNHDKKGNKGVQYIF